jgi:hypothetical protein
VGQERPGGPKRRGLLHPVTRYPVTRFKPPRNAATREPERQTAAQPMTTAPAGTRARSAFRQLIRAIDRNFTAVTGNAEFRQQALSQFRDGAAAQDAKEVERRLALAEEYAFLIGNIASHKAGQPTEATLQGLGAPSAYHHRMRQLKRARDAASRSMHDANHATPSPLGGPHPCA